MADEVIVVDVVYDTVEAEKNISNLTEDIIWLESANKDLRKEIKKSDDELKKEGKSRVELSKQVEKNNESLKDSKKERRDLIKVQKLQGNSIDALKQKNKDLVKTRNAIDTSSKKGQKEFKALNSQISDNNDTLSKAEQGGGNFGRSVGKYTEAIEGAIPGIGAVKGATMSLFKAILTNPIGILIAALVLLVQSFMKTQEGADDFAKVFKIVTDIIDVFIGRIADLAKNILKFIKGESSFAELKEQAKDSFKGIREEIEATVKESARIFELTKALREFNIETTKTLAALGKEAEIQAAIADDATRSFQERQAAAAKAEAAVISQRQTELALAEKNLEIIQAENKLKKDQGLLLDDLKQNEATAIAEATEAQKNLTLARLEASKRRSELAQDNFEQELDFLLDVADVQKTVNEKRMKDERIAFEQRKGILEETTTLLNQSFDQQIGLFENEFNISIERSKLADLNNKEIFEYARGLGLSEIATNRLLEVIRERRLAIQDLSDAQKDITDEETERNLELIEITDQLNEGLDEQIEKELELENQKVASSIKAAEVQIENIRKVPDEDAIASENRIAMAQDLANRVADIANAAFNLQGQQLEQQRKKELVAAGDDEKKKEAIEVKFAKKRKKLAIKQALISGAQAVLNGLLTQPFVPAGIIAGAAAAVLAGIQVAAISKQQFGKGGQVKVMAGGGSLKSGMFSGSSHSGGGIDLFTGSGQHVANVEGRENFYVVNKNASDMINSLSAINQGTGGVPLSKSSNFMQRGGQGDIPGGAGLSSDSIRQIVADTVANMPPTVVQVEDITTGITDRASVKNVAVVA